MDDGARTAAGLVRPRRLRAGDRLAAVTLSWAGPAEHPRRYTAGVRQLEAAFDVEVVELPHTRAPQSVLGADPLARVEDLHRAFTDPDIAGVVSTIGGDDSIRLLPHLDRDLLAANPTVLLGYSDTTVTQLALRRAGVVAFSGPAIMSGFAESGGLHRYLVEGVRRTLFTPEAPLEWPENPDGWTAEHVDWDAPGAQDRRRPLQPTTGWRWHGGQAGEGPTVVGCFEVLDWLRGTCWWPPLEGAVLLLETSEEAPPPEAVARFLRVLALTGELTALAGLVVGRPGGADLSVGAHADYDAAILRVVRDEAGCDDLPVVTGVDFGHTDPMWTVPMGVRLRVDPHARRLTFLEAGVC